MSKTPKQGYTLRTYARLQGEYDQKFYLLLRRIEAELKDLVGKYTGGGSMSDLVRADQLQQVRLEAQRMMVQMLQNAGLTVEAGKIAAAAAAIDVSFAYERVLMESAGISAEALAVYKAGEQRTARLGLEAARERLLGSSYIPLSDQVWRTTALASGALDRLIDSALAMGFNAREFANAIAAFANPNAPGGLSYVTMRLARTEINNAFHAIQVEKANRTPWVTGVEWNLSGSHPTPDECNEYAEGVHAEGFEPGVFPTDKVPKKPHPQCMCYMTSEIVDTDKFIDSLLDGSYDRYLDDVMRSSGFSADFIRKSRLR